MMNPRTRITPPLLPAALLAALLAAALLFGLAAGCDFGSSDSATAVLADASGRIYHFSGFYAHPSGNADTPLVHPVGRQSGVPLVWMRLMQYGSVLEAYDNANQKWSGKISALDGPAAAFSLRGQTTAGQAVDVVGTMTYAEQKSRIDATWIEPSFSGNFFALANVPAPTTNVPTSQLRVSPPSTTLDASQPTAPLSVSGGVPPYTWRVASASLGSVSPASGASTVYSRTATAGTNVVTATDSLGATATATVAYRPSGSVGGDFAIEPEIRRFEAGGGRSGTYVATNGTPPYTWRVSDETLGTLSSTTGSTVTYNRTDKSGRNVITATDGAGATATAYAEF